MIKPKVLHNNFSGILYLIIIVFTVPMFAGPGSLRETGSKNSKEFNSGEEFRPEHIMFNVPDPVAMVKWYEKNLGMVAMSKGKAPTYSTFISDPGNHMMLELGNFADFPKMEFSKVDINTMHLALVTENIKEVKKKLVGAGAVVAQDIFKTPGGDQVMVLRDPWGLPIQFVERADPMFKYTGLRIEHLEFNVPDTRAKAKWYADKLHMEIVRRGGAPTYNIFVSDPGHNVMMELNQNKDYPMFDFWKISHMAFHFAFEAEDLQAVKKEMIAAGAQLVDDITMTPGGDQVMMMRDPWGEPIQFVHRAHPMLK